MDFKNILGKLSDLSKDSSKKDKQLIEGRRLQDRMISEESDKKERPYICVHAKKYAPYECHAKTSYEAAKMAAEHWGMKSTAGIDVHLADVEHTPVNESLKDIFNRLSEELLSENQIKMEPARQDTQVIKKNDEVIGTVSNPALASQLKRGIESGEVSLDQEMNEDAGHSILDVISKDEARLLNWYLGNTDLPPSDLDPGIFYTSDLYKKLYDYYLESGEMPIDIAKNRTGDSESWVLDQVEKDYGRELEDYMNESKLTEKWKGDAEVEATGEYADKTISELKSMLSKLKKSGPHKEGSKEYEKQNQIEFAIRAKKGWKGGVSEGERPQHGSDFGAGLGAGRSEIALEGRTKKDNKAEKAGKKVTKDIEYDEKVKDKIHGKKRHAEDEKAEKAGKKVAKDIEYDEKKKSKKNMNESMEECIKAAELEGKSHGLKGHAHIGDSFDTPEKARAYHQGYKDGLDERFGVRDVEPAATVPGMASQSMSFDMGDDADFSAWEKELNEILENDKDEDSYQAKIDKIMARLERDTNRTINPDIINDLKGQAAEEIYALERERDSRNKHGSLEEGLSVSISKGQQGSPDSVSVTAQDHEAEELLQLVKHLSGGLFGDSKEEVSDYGAPKADVGVNDHDQMMSLMKAVSVKPEDDCHVCHEDESEDQMEFKVAEDNQPDSGAKDSVADEDAEAQEDQALAGAMSGNEEEIDEGSHYDEDADLMEFLSSLEESDDYKVDEDDALEEEEQMDETNAFIAARRDAIKKGHNEFEVDGKKYPVKGADDKEAEGIDEGIHYDEEDDEDFFTDKNWRERYGELEDEDIDEGIHYDKEDDEDLFLEEGQLNEWANDAGRNGTDEAFQQDIDFMTKVISGGLNKQKKDQTTLPHTKVKVEGESPEDWMKLAGIKK